MSSRMKGCLDAAINLGDQDATALADGIEAYLKAGVPIMQAEKMAVNDTLAAVQAERVEMVQLLREQHAPLFAARQAAPAPASATQTRPELPPAPAEAAPTADTAPTTEQAPESPIPQAVEAEQPRAKITDFGQKLEGARKDYAATMKDAMDVDVAAEPLSKSWPEPDYQKLLAGGANPFTVAFIRAARDEVPTKPQTAWKLKGWVESVTALRSMAHGLLNGSVTKEALETTLPKSQFRNVRAQVGGRAEMYELLGHERSLKGVTLAENHYSLYRGQENVTKWVVEQKAKATAFSNWPRELAVGDTKAEVLAALKSKFATMDLGRDAKKQPQFVIYRKRGQEGAFIGKKIGREYVDLHKADDVPAARKYMAENAAALERALEKYRDTPMERRPENQPRVGDDHRNGAPVTPEQFGEAFGFRGVQFGNYVEQGRRQSDLNEAYDALMDMAAVLGIPPKALSLNGKLGLAFGARGKGGKNAPAAHYEPGTVVINLTKGGGPGSLAHEWWHSLDNYFGGNGDQFVTGGAKPPGLRDAMRTAFDAVKRATQAPTLRRRAHELDKRRSKPYWDTPHELSARAFESYVIAKLNDQGAANDYLANVVDEEVWNITESARAEFFGGDKDAQTYPYPGQAELPAVRTAFDEFFRTVETRETDTGTEMLDRDSTFPDTEILPLPEVAEIEPATARDQAVLDKAAKNYREKQPAAFGSLQLTALPELKQPSASAPAAEHLRYAAVKLAKDVFGKRVVFYRANIPFANGFQASWAPGYIFIAENTKRPVMAALGHEMLHGLRTDKPELYSRLGDRLRAVLENPGAYHEALAKRYAEAKIKGLDFDKTREELIADIMGDFFTEKTFWQQMASAQPTLFGRLLKAVRDFLNDVLAKLQSQRPYGTERYLNDVRRARDIVAEIMGDYAAAAKDGQRVGPTYAMASLSAGGQEYTAPNGTNPPPGTAQPATVAPVRRAGDALPRNPRIRALGIADRIEAAGSQSLVGQRVESAGDLAALAQVYRDPRYETFRAFFVKAGEIVHAMGVSARLPGSTPMVPAGMTETEYVDMYRQTMKTLGADGYYILHNHPTGDPEPSSADKTMTDRLGKLVPGMLAHVVINSNKYATFGPNDAPRIVRRDFGAEVLLTASKPSPLLGRTIATPEQLADIGKSLQRDGWLTVVGTDSTGKVRVIADAPQTILARTPLALAAMARRLMRQSGANNIFVVGSDADVNSRVVIEGIKRGFITDAVGDAGRSMRAQGLAGPSGTGFKDTKGRWVLREDPPADQPMSLQTDDPEAPRRRTGWFDATNRLQFAPGKWLFEALGDAAGPLLAKVGLKAASPELRHQLRQMKLVIQKAQETASAVVHEANKLSDEEREMVSDIIEQEVGAGVMPPQHAVRLAAVMSQTMSKQTRELVDLGMLSQESAERWDGKYLPRFYESKLRKQVGDAWADAVRRVTGRTSAMTGIRGKHLKGRGMWEVIPTADLESYEELGWEVRDPDFTPESPEVQVWRDYTREERDNMGEIRDAGFRFVMGYMQTQRDIALGRMFEGMANDPATSSRLPKGKDWVQVPKTVVPGTGVTRYGKLAGRFVPGEVMSHLSQIEEASSEAWQIYRKAMGLWKEGKTALNPVSHMNNIVSNLSMAHFAGVSYHRGDKYLFAMKDFIRGSPMINEAREAGLFLGTMTQAEILDALPPELKELVAKADSKTVKTTKWVYNAMTLFLRKPMGKAYQAEDTFFRYLIYRDARKHGATPTEAVDYAQEFIFTYDDLPKGARMIRDFGIPFFAYTYKFVPAALHTALVYPWRIAAPAALLYAANAAAYAIAVGDDEDDWYARLEKYLTDPAHRERAREQEKLERDQLPPWMRGLTSLATPKTVRLGMDEVTRLPLFLDVSRFIPGGDIFDVSPNAGGLPIPQPITPNHPLMTTFVAMIGNKDLFTGKPVVDLNDTSAEAVAKRGDWIWKQFSPAIAAGNAHWERGMNALAQASGGEITWLPEVIADKYTGIDKMGQPVQPQYAAAQTFGIKLRPIDLEKSEQIDKSLRQKVIRDIDIELRRLRMMRSSGAVSDRAYEKAREAAIVKKQNLRQGLTLEGAER